MKGQGKSCRKGKFFVLCSSHKGLRTAVHSHWLYLVVGEADLVVQSLFAVLSLFSHTMESSEL